MRIFISHSHEDKPVIEQITNRLKAAGHTVLVDPFELRSSDNYHQKIEKALKDAEVLLVVISENSFRSVWVQREFSTIALQQLSTRERRIIPVKIDKADVPSYLANRFWLDLSENFDAGLERLILQLKAETQESLGPSVEPKSDVVRDRAGPIAKLQNALRRGRLTLMCGAGISVEAGIPKWDDLLAQLLGDMMERLSKNRALDITKEAAANFQEQRGYSALILGKYLKNNLNPDFSTKVRDALYSGNPRTSELIDAIVQLSRPTREGRPLDSIVTFNFDSLIEENLTESRIKNRPIFSEATRHQSGEMPVYHVHGYLPRSGPISKDADLVFSEDAYHSQFIEPFRWSNLIQLNKLTQNICLFIGISLVDPNMRRLLDVAWRKNPDQVKSHYVVKKLPQSKSGGVLDRVSKLLEEQDANALGLNVIWYEEFDELPMILNEIAEADEGS